MNSRLAIERPDIWQRGLALATGLTGVLYLPKLPSADGTIFACGGSGNWRDYGPYNYPSDSQARWEIDRFEKIISELERDKTPEWEEKVKFYREKLIPLKKRFEAASVLVPDGAMEWLLHEVGHWIAATPAERQLPNYGDGHEIEAWAFEEIVLGQFGSARHFAPPTQRDGTAFDLSGPLPDWAFRHIDRRIHDDRVAVEQFQLLWSDWVQWGTTLGTQAPWSSEVRS